MSCVVRMWLLLIGSFLLAVLTGFGISSHGAFWYGAAGQVAQGLLSIACFAFIVLAFWRYGWKVGLLEAVVVIIGSNVGVSVFKRVARRGDKA
ncbi:MAG: hypothetical protein ACXV8H_05095 [Chthoniobacterales bacterium]